MLSHTIVRAVLHFSMEAQRFAKIGKRHLFDIFTP